MNKLYLEQVQKFQAEPPAQEGRTVTTYKVTKVIGSTKPKVGEVLSEQHVADLCDQTGTWLVTITS